MAFEDEEIPIVDIDLENLPIVNLGSTKVKRPKKPSKVTPKQEFKIPLPPSITELPPPSRFKFAKGPFRETIQAETPQELGQKRGLAEAERRGAFVARAETPAEAEETEAIRKQQELKDYYGSLYPIRQGLGKLGTGAVEPFQAVYGGAARYFKGLIEGKSREELLKEEERLTALRTGDFSKYVDQGYDPLRFQTLIPAAVEIAGQGLLFKGGRPRQPDIIGIEPFRGGARVGIRPPVRPSPPPRPVRGLLGEGPPTMMAPAVRPTKPTYLPPRPDELARLDPGRMRPMADMGVMSEGGPIGKPIADDLSFDLLPALRPGQAPVMIAPQWVIDAVMNNTTGRIVEGVSLEFDLIPGIISRLRNFAPSSEHLNQAVKAIGDVENAAKAEGLNSISLKSQEIRKRRETFEADREEFEKLGVVPPEIGSHETTHAGQYKIAEEFLNDPDLTRLYDKDWAASHPNIQEAILKKPSWTPEIAAVELPAYVMGRQTLRYFKTSAEGIDFLFDSLNHLRDRFGDRALEILETTTRILPELEDVIPLVRSMYDTWQLERAEREARSAGAGQLPVYSEGLQPTEIRGLESRTGKTGVGAASGEAPGISPADRGANLDRFVERSAVKVPTYHGTSSPTEIAQIDPSKFDPNALYGPGFYTTQSPKIAAGEEKGYTQKEIRPTRQEYRDMEESIHREEASRIGFNIPPDQRAVEYMYGTKRTEELYRTPNAKLIDDLDTALINARERTDKWDREVRSSGKPHAYQLYLNIEKPFDIDKSLTPDEVTSLIETIETKIKTLPDRVPQPDLAQFLEGEPQDLTGRNRIKRNLSRMIVDLRDKLSGTNPDVTGKYLYDRLETAFVGDKAEVNKFLQEAGYDGITHIGGMGKEAQWYDDPEAARKEAERTGGQLIDRSSEPSWETGDRKWGVRGHKVWIAFRPEQVKSATGNIGTFDPTRPEMSLSEQTFSPGDKVVFTDSPILGQGEVIEAKGDIAKVKFAGGQTLSVAVERLAKVEAPQITKKEENLKTALGGAGKAITENFHKMLRESVEKTGKLPLVEKDSSIDKAFEALVTGGAPRDVTTLDAAITSLGVSPTAKQAEQPAAPTVQAPTPGQAPEGKIVPTLPGPMKIRGASLNVAKMGPGDEPGKIRIEFADGTTSQFNIDDVRDRRGRRIKDPILYMIVKDPPVIGDPKGPAKLPPMPAPPTGREKNPLYVPVVSNVTTKILTEKFSELLASNNIEYNFTSKVSEQVYLALIEGRIKDAEIERVLGEEGVAWEDFASDALFSVSEGARTMAHYSHVVRRHWLRLLKENPGFIQKNVPPATQIKLMLDEMKRSVLGMNLWRRLGRDTQKALLTQLATATVNFMSATLRVPADAASSIVGAMLQQVMEGEGTFAEKLVKARAAAEATLTAHVEVARALNPMQVEELSRGQLGSEYSEHEQIITQLERYFPDIHSKLFARTYGEEAEALSKVEQYLPAARLLLPKVKNESKRRDLDRQIHKFEKRMKFEKSAIMYLPRKGEWILDHILRPANFGEFLLRRPRFVGRLRLELMDKGIDLDQVIRDGEFSKVPEESLRAALSDALEFTMAYDPRGDKDASYIERFIAVPFIKIMSALGPLSLQISAFPRAMVSAFKTTMEYTPLPILAGWRENSPFRRVFWKETRKDPKTGTEYNPNPPTRGDYDRVGRAIVGTFLLTLAWVLIKEGVLDEDGKKLKLPAKGPGKRPVTVDVERFKPISTHFRVAALIDRLQKGTMGDKNAASEIYEIVTGMRRYEGEQDPIDILNSVAEFASGETDSLHKLSRAEEEAGRMFVSPFLTPLLNLRAVIGEIDEDENLKKDLKGYGFWGPSLDKIPVLRRRLPNQVYPLEPGPVRLSIDPALAGLAGVQILPDQNVVGREFRRLGLNIRSYLKSDPDPIINRAQNRKFQILSAVIGGIKMREPAYKAASDEMKAAMLEDIILEENGIADAAREAGLAANPMEAERRGLKGELPGKYRRKAVGLDKVLDVLQGVTRK